MEIDFSALSDAQALKQLLESHLPIGKATMKDVQESLHQQNLDYSEEIKQDDKHFNALLKTLKYTNQSNRQFDSFIGCKISVKPNRISTCNPFVRFWAFLTAPLVKWHYLLRFHFEKGILVEIFTKKVGTGF